MNIYGDFIKENLTGLTQIGDIPKKVLDLVYRKIADSDNDGIGSSFSYFQSTGMNKEGFHCITLDREDHIQKRLRGLQFARSGQSKAMNPSLFMTGNVPRHTDTNWDSDIIRERGLLIPISLPEEKELSLGEDNYLLHEGGIYILNHHIPHSFNRKVSDIVHPSIFLSATVFIST